MRWSVERCAQLSCRAAFYALRAGFKPGGRCAPDRLHEAALRAMGSV
jgi:hypothetical protein